MDVNAVIQQLRNYCPALQSVSGAAELEAAETLGNLPLPAAYVVPLSIDAGPNESQTGIYQVITESVAVVVVLDNRVGGGIGQSSGSIAYDAMTTAVFAALLNWQLDPVESPRGLSLAGVHLIKQDRARIWYQYVFDNTRIIDDSDGFQITGPDYVGATFTPGPPGQDYAPFEVDEPPTTP